MYVLLKEVKIVLFTSFVSSIGQVLAKISFRLSFWSLNRIHP